MLIIVDSKVGLFLKTIKPLKEQNYRNQDLKKYQLEDIVKGDSIFCATGITNGELVKGVEMSGDYFITDTFVTHKSRNIKKI